MLWVTRFVEVRDRTDETRLMSITPPAAQATGTVTSRDGTTIAYRRLGDGPGAVLVHGGGQASQNLVKLATALSDRFTVYVPDRRGRGLSGPYSEGHGLHTEIEDLDVLLQKTDAHNVFGLSVGAVVAIEAARSLSGITKLALYEPPLSFDGVSQTLWVPRYERELKAGQLAAALVTIMKGTADRTALRYVPRFVLVREINRVIQKTDGKPVPPGMVSPRDLIPTMHYDARTVMDAAGPLERFAELPCELLLLGGAKSARNLTAALDGLSVVLPHACRVTLPGVGHTAADNGGKPELVAAELRAFFDASSGTP
jgi:pimeloyl-ACP methyl ester carboxylesterase